MSTLGIKIYIFLIITIEFGNSWPENDDSEVDINIKKTIDVEYDNVDYIPDAFGMDDYLKKNGYVNTVSPNLPPEPDYKFKPCPDGVTFCNGKRQLSDDAVDRILEKFQISFNKIVQNENVDVIMESRFNEDRTPLCMSDKKKYSPDWGKNRQSNWVELVNTKQNPQYIITEICRYPNETCTNTDPVKSEYTATCRQFYAYRQVWALNDTEKIYPDVIEVPSCCKCVMTENDNKLY